VTLTFSEDFLDLGATLVVIVSTLVRMFLMLSRFSRHRLIQCLGHLGQVFERGFDVFATLIRTHGSSQRLRDLLQRPSRCPRTCLMMSSVVCASMTVLMRSPSFNSTRPSVPGEIAK